MSKRSGIKGTNKRTEKKVIVDEYRKIVKEQKDIDEMYIANCAEVHWPRHDTLVVWRLFRLHGVQERMVDVLRRKNEFKKGAKVRKRTMRTYTHSNTRSSISPRHKNYNSSSSTSTSTNNSNNKRLPLCAP